MADHPVSERDAVALTRPERHLQGVQDQFGLHRGVGHPADDPAAERVDDERDVDHSGLGHHVGEIGDPEFVRGVGGEVPVDEIPRSGGLVAGDRGAALAGTSDALKPFLTHQSLHGAPGDRDAFAAQMSPDLVGPVGAVAVIVDSGDLHQQPRVASSSRRRVGPAPLDL